MIYYPNGDVAVKGNYQNNLKEGDWIYYLKNGQIFVEKKDPILIKPFYKFFFNHMGSKRFFFV